MHRRMKQTIASILALATVAPMAASIAPMTASAAGQLLGETSFEHKALPWHTCETSPAKQNFRIEDGTFHVTIKTALGGAKAKWDLQFRHRNLNFKAGHTYEVSFTAKAKREGMELCSKIGNTKGDEEYFDLKPEGFVMGPHMGGGGMGWGSPVKLSTSYQTWSGTFTPTQDLEGVEWAFHYANGQNGEGGNAEDGDEIWFDEMSITCPDGEGPGPDEAYGATNRHYSKLENNYISVNQLGYFPDCAKIAVLGDNKGDILYGAESISLSGTYEWELVSSSGTVVKTGTTSSAKKDEDSADTVCKIDFSDYKTPGTYYLRIKGKEWRSFEFKIGDDIYTESGHDMLTNAINYFYQNRSGLDIKSAYITSRTEQSNLAHEGGHKTDKAYVQPKWQNEYESKTAAQTSSTITANKGWYDAGDHGKYVVNGGIAVWTLQNMYERSTYAKDAAVKSKFEDNSGVVVVPEAGNDIPDVLDECKYELDFIEAMKVDSSEPTWGKYAGMYYHKLHDHKWTGLATKPWDYEGPTDQGGWDTTRIVKPPTFAATLNFAACAAQAARLWKPYDATQAAKYLKEAKEAYAAYEKNYYPADKTKKKHPELGCECSAEEINEKSLYAPMWQAKGGGPYGDDEVKDDAYWAACEIFISAQEMGDSDASTYLTKLSDYTNAFKVTTRITGGENATGEGSFTTFNWGNTASAGSLSLAMHKQALEDAGASASDIAKLDASICEAADAYVAMEKQQGYGIPYIYDGPGYNDPNNLDPEIIIKGYEWGSNSMVINNLIVMAYAYDLTQDKTYLNGVTQGMDYLLGTNPLSFSYITGYGSYHEKNPHHRYWSKELDKTLPEAPDGILSGGPNAGLQDPYVRALGFVPGEDSNPSQRCFVDSIEAWSTNEVTINWNAPLAWIVEFLQDKDAKYEYGGGGIIPPDVDYGNVDCSEGATKRDRVDVGDAVLLARFLAEDSTATISEDGQRNANVVSGDGLTADDVTKILKFVAFMIDEDALGTSSK